MMNQTDRYYIERSLNGHSDDFRHLVESYQPALLAHLVGQLGNKEHAEEIAQEAFVRAYFALEKLKKPDSFFSWLLGVAKRVVKEEQKSQERRRRREVVHSVSEFGPAPEFSKGYGLEKAIAELSGPYREVILLRYYSCSSCSEVAEKLGMPVGTVTKTLSRAYSMLRKSMNQQKHQRNDEVRK
ncbi:RNA polymerase sigma factor [Planctomycetota bacterium]